MATRARFGRLPRSAPSLTSTIVSLAQEYQRTRDNNIEDAWKSGGLFEGKKVTDDMFLDHWRDRLKSVSQDDPMWDYYNNLIYQYNFTIDESKMGQKYAEKKVSDSQMAQFYRKWAAKMPKNSENYRQLMTQAAKFKSAAASRASGSASQAAAKLYQNKQQHTYNSHEAAYDVTTQVLTKYAVANGYLTAADLVDSDGKPRKDYGWGALTNASGENDPINFAAMMTDIMGNPDVRAGLTHYIRQFDKGFSGTFDDESLARLANNARNGAMIRAQRAHKAGDKTGENDANSQVNTYAKSSMVIRASLGDNSAPHNGFVEQNEAYRARFDEINRPESGASPAERIAARDQYRDWLQGDGGESLIKAFPAGSFDPLNPNFNVWAAGLLGRAKGTVNALNGHPTSLTLKDDLFGFSTGEAGPESDAVKMGTSLGKLDLDYGDVLNVDPATGLSKKIVVKVDDADNIDPHGKHWAIYDRTDKDVAERELIPFAVPSSGAPGGGEIRYTAAEPVTVQVYGAADPNTGRGTAPGKLNPTADQQVGSRVEVVGPNGQTFVLWSVMDAGTKVWTKDNPFMGEGKTEGRDPQGNYTIGYVDPRALGQPGKPGQTYTPSGFINKDMIKRNVNGIDSTDGKPWNPAVDKEMGFGSPLAAFANTSTENAKFVAGMNPELVRRTETEYYAKPENWTPDMKRQAAQGFNQADIVDAAARGLGTQLGVMQRDGFTPEDQQRTRSTRAAAEAQATAESMGYANAEDFRQANLRSSIASDLDKWAQQGMPVNSIIAANQAKIGATGAASSRAEAWVKKGWTVYDLLNQPGMSTDQANDLAAIISGGAVGKRLEGAQMTRNLPGRGPQTYTAQPAANPFAVIPVKPPGAPAPVKTAVAPTPKAAPVKYKPPGTYGIEVNYPTVNAPVVGTGPGEHRNPGDPWGF